MGLSSYDSLFEAIYKVESQSAESEEEENHPTSPDDIPLSRAGSLFLLASFVFSSILFESQIPQNLLLQALQCR